MKATTILTKVLDQINEQIYNDDIFVTVYGKKMEAILINGYFHVCIDWSLSNAQVSKILTVNELLRNYVF